MVDERIALPDDKHGDTGCLMSGQSDLSVSSCTFRIGRLGRPACLHQSRIRRRVLVCQFKETSPCLLGSL